MNFNIHKSLWLAMAIIIFSLMMLSNSAYAELPKAARADKYKLQIADSLKNEKYADALKYIKKLEALKLKVPDSIMYFKGEASYHMLKWDISKDALEEYINKTGAGGKYYKDALDYLGKLDEGNWAEWREKMYGTQLHFAAFEGRLYRVKELLDEDKSLVNSRQNRRQRTPLWYAAGCGHYEVVQELIKRGAEIHGVPGRAHIGCYGEARIFDVVELLIKNGADANDGGPLFSATGNRDVALMKLLIKSGANLHEKDWLGNTAMHRTVFYIFDYDDNAERYIKRDLYERDLRGIVTLIDEGADLNIKNKEGKTPLDLAEITGAEKVILLLKKHGAKRGGDL